MIDSDQTNANLLQIINQNLIKINGQKNMGKIGMGVRMDYWMKKKMLSVMIKLLNLEKNIQLVRHFRILILQGL